MRGPSPAGASSRGRPRAALQVRRGATVLLAVERGRRIILVDVDPDAGDRLSRRLVAQGYEVERAADGAAGAEMALASPPAALLADLWMPGVSGIQLTRLLRSEAATADVPVILRGDRDDPRSRFWAERAGAYAFVPKGRFGELVRVLSKCTEHAPDGDGFFFQLAPGNIDIRDRIAQHLDRALFDLAIAAEVRALANAGNVERVFDRLSQFMSQVVGYRWLAVSLEMPRRAALHHHPLCAADAEVEAREVLAIPESVFVSRVEDEDARSEAIDDEETVVHDIPFGDEVIGRLALGGAESTEAARSIASLVARELGGPICIASLVEESQRLASTDLLTGLWNRRAFISTLEPQLERRAGTLALLMLDVDKFKAINDGHGHATGDRVLAEIGALLKRTLRQTDIAARWGGEEIVVALAVPDLASAEVAAERVRAAVQALEVHDDGGSRVPVTTSGGLALLEDGETLDALMSRADRALYAAKAGGRNRIIACPTTHVTEDDVEPLPSRASAA